MGIDTGTILTIFLAIILASFVEHKLWGSQTETVTKSNADVKEADLTTEAYVRRNFPNAMTV